MESMNQPILTFSPDGGQHVYAFTGKLIWFAWGILAIVGCCSLAMVKAYELAMGLVNFVLTANLESLVRIAVLVVIGVGLIVFFRWQKGARHEAGTTHRVGA
jgi:hypothetical protein